MSINYLQVKHKDSLLKLLQKYEEMFDGTLGKYTDSDYAIELQKEAKPYHTQPILIPNIHDPVLSKKVDKFINLEVLKKINNSQSKVPTFIIPKINGIVRLITYSRELTQTIKTKPFPIPKHSTTIT